MDTLRLVVGRTTEDDLAGNKCPVRLEVVETGEVIPALMRGYSVASKVNDAREVTITLIGVEIVSE